jgi:hypothetical protein
VAVPVPDTASSIFKQYYLHGIPKIMISTIFWHSLSILLFLFKPEFLKPDPVAISMWLCRFRVLQVAFLTILSTRYSQNNDIYYFPLAFSINFVTFIQASILETGPGGN